MGICSNTKVGFGLQQIATEIRSNAYLPSHLIIKIKFYQISNSIIQLLKAESLVQESLDVYYYLLAVARF